MPGKSNSRAEQLRKLSPLPKIDRPQSPKESEPEHLDSDAKSGKSFTWMDSFRMAVTAGSVLSGNLVSQPEMVQMQMAVSQSQTDELVNLVLGVIPAENTQSLKAETKSILEEAEGLAKAQMRELAKKAIDKTVETWIIGRVLLAVGNFLRKRGEQTGNRYALVLAEVFEKLAALFGAAPPKVVTKKQLLDEIGPDHIKIAGQVLRMIGFEEGIIEWRERPK